MMLWDANAVREIVEPYTKCVVNNDYPLTGGLFADNCAYWLPGSDVPEALVLMPIAGVRNMAEAWKSSFDCLTITLLSVQFFRESKNFEAQFQLSATIETPALGGVEQLRIEAEFHDDIYLNGVGSIGVLKRHAFPAQFTVGNPDMLWTTSTPIEIR